MYYIGLDVHKKTISYCVKDGSGRICQEGKVARTPISKQRNKHISGGLSKRRGWRQGGIPIWLWYMKTHGRREMPIAQHWL